MAEAGNIDAHGPTPRRSRSAESDFEAFEEPASDALIDAESAFLELANTLPQMVWITAPNGYHKHYNKHWWDYTGLTYEQARGEGWSKILHPDDAPRAQQRWNESLASGEPYEIEYRIRRQSDGSYRWFLGRALPRKNSRGEIIEWFGTCTDIHEQKMAQQAFKEAKEQMMRANSAKDTFLATVSHELRTPLNAILGWTQILAEEKVSIDEQKHALSRIQRNAESQAQLIEDLLDVSRIVNGKLKVELAPTPLSHIVFAAIDSVMPRAREKNIIIRAAGLDHEPTVMADASRLQQVFWNLITNAVKFTPASGRVEINVQQADESLQVSVSDNGKGIAQEFLPLIFDRFSQADGTSTRSHGGLGLGLAIVKHLVELHGGKIEVKSDGVGYGSTFTVTLPSTKLKPLVEKESPNAEVLAPDILNGVRILAVDDEESAREIVSATLERFGATVKLASSVIDGLRIFESWKPDLVVTDIGMPGYDGYDFIHRLKMMMNVSADGNTDEFGNRTPVVALTAFASLQDRTRALAEGFDRYITKPVNMNELVGTVADLLGTTTKPQ